MDFTLKVYRKLLTTLLEGGFSFQTFKEFLADPEKRVVILRHDVDLRPKDALMTAGMEHGLGIRGTYYFRTLPLSYDEGIIKKVYGLGHEVGYHYENMDKVKGEKNFKKPHIDAAWEDFKENLERFRKLVPVHTIAMHGSPRSRFNNLDIWKKYDYRELGIIAEPYFEIDFNDVFYITDTGRMWDGHKASIRDKVNSDYKKYWPMYHSTLDIIEAVKKGEFPDRVMMNFHPQRWSDDPFLWTKELVSQKVKNVIKRGVIKIRS